MKSVEIVSLQIRLIRIPILNRRATLLEHSLNQINSLTTVPNPSLSLTQPVKHVSSAHYQLNISTTTPTSVSNAIRICNSMPNNKNAHNLSLNLTQTWDQMQTIIAAVNLPQINWNKHVPMTVHSLTGTIAYHARSLNILISRTNNARAAPPASLSALSKSHVLTQNC